MTTNHIDQLAEWWENAEVPTSATLPKDGDRIIIRYNSEWYEVATADGDASVHDLSSYTRILARAPKPKPAWHDAVAVMAVTPGRPERRVFTREVEPGWWVDADSSYKAAELAHVTPLIEAKVTDEMVKRAAQSLEDAGGDTSDGNAALTGALTAALGLETE